MATASASTTGEQWLHDQSPDGVALDSGVFRISFRQAAIDAPVEIELLDRTTGHALHHAGDRLWEVRLMDIFHVTDPHPFDDIELLKPSDCSPGVLWRVLPLSGPQPGERLLLQWSDCSNLTLEQTSDRIPWVQLAVDLVQGDPFATFTLSASPDTEAQWAFWSGNYRFSLEDRSANNLDTYLLMPLNAVMTNPAQNLLHAEELGDQGWVGFGGHPATQLCAYYDGDGNGLYLHTVDETGDLLMDFQFSAHRPVGEVPPFRTNYNGIMYSTHTTEADRELSCVPLRVGRFRGDWFDAALAYRDWLETEATGPGEIASRGSFRERDDVSEAFKDISMIGVLGFPIDDYWFWGPDDLLAGEHTGTLSDRLRLFKNHWGLENLVTLQWGAHWFEGAVDTCGLGKYELQTGGPDWARNFENMNQGPGDLDLPLWVYLRDVDYAHLPACSAPDTYTTESWYQEVMKTPDGQEISFYGQPGMMKIDPSTAKWQSRMEQVAHSLASHGVEGFFWDNAYPLLEEYPGWILGPLIAREMCFDPAHGHEPGLGPYMSQGFADSMDRARELGGQVNPSGFELYTEIWREGYIPHQAFYQPPQLVSDFIDIQTGHVHPGSQDTGVTEIVPVTEVLYHHLVQPGAATVLPYIRTGWNYPELLLHATDQDVRESSRRGACFTHAFGWVNGGIIGATDMGYADPVDWADRDGVPDEDGYGLFSFEYPIADPHYNFEWLAEYTLVCAFEARLARLRNASRPSARFLSGGRRVRDVHITSPDPIPRNAVPLAPQLVAWPPEYVVEVVDAPDLLQSVWENRSVGTLGIAFVNHSTNAYDGSGAHPRLSFDFTPADYDLAASVNYLVVDVSSAHQATAIEISGTATSNLTYSLPGESALFLIVSPQGP